MIPIIVPNATAMPTPGPVPSEAIVIGNPGEEVAVLIGDPGEPVRILS